MDGPDGPGGPGGGDDQPPFDPDARADVLSIEEDYARLNKDMDMLCNLAMPDYKNGCAEAEALLEQCRRVVTPEYVAQRLCREIMNELGYPPVVVAALSEKMTSEEKLVEYLAFSIIPYSIEAYGVSPYNTSERLGRYAGFSGKCAHKDLLLGWYGDV